MLERGKLSKRSEKGRNRKQRLSFRKAERKRNRKEGRQVRRKGP